MFETNKESSQKIKNLSVLWQKYRTIRFALFRWQDCGSRRTETTGSGCFAFRAPGHNEDASWKQYILVVNENTENMQHMHCIHEFWKEYKIPNAIDGKKSNYRCWPNTEMK